MKSKNGLLVITELFLPTKGGTAVWFDEVYRRLGGKEIHIVTAEVAGVVHDDSHPNSIHRLRLRRHWWLKPESLAMYTRFLFKAIQIMLSNSVTAIHAGRVLPEGLVGWVVAMLFRRPLIVYAHGEEITGWRHPAKRKTMAFVYRHADRVIANSRFTHEQLLDLQVQEERIERISPGVDIERFRPGLPTEDLFRRLNLPPDTQLILSVGRLSRRKGFDQVIRALPEVLDQHPGVHYAIIGTGGDDIYLQGIAQEIGVADRVHFLGHVPMEELPRWYNACRVFAMPNREINGDNEGFGMVYLEAGACGKPAIAGLAGGTGDAVHEGVTGLRVDGRDVGQISAALLKLLDQGEMMGKKALEVVRSGYSWECVVKRTRNLTLT